MANTRNRSGLTEEDRLEEARQQAMQAMRAPVDTATKSPPGSKRGSKKSHHPKRHGARRFIRGRN